MRLNSTESKWITSNIQDCYKKISILNVQENNLHQYLMMVLTKNSGKIMILTFSYILFDILPAIK